MSVHCAVCMCLYAQYINDNNSTFFTRSPQIQIPGKLPIAHTQQILIIFDVYRQEGRCQEGTYMPEPSDCNAYLFCVHGQFAKFNCQVLNLVYTSLLRPLSDNAKRGGGGEGRTKCLILCRQKIVSVDKRYITVQN
jgi:hypothetical protein